MSCNNSTDNIDKKNYAGLPGSRIPRNTSARQTKSLYEKKTVKLNKARPAPDFSKLHSKWQDKLQDGLAKAKKPTTVPSGFYLNQRTKSQSNFEEPIIEKTKPTEAITPKSRLRQNRTLDKSAKRSERRRKREPVHVSQSNLTAGGIENEYHEFTADPNSLAQILGHKPVTPKLAPSKNTRMSIYDKIDQKMKLQHQQSNEHLAGRYSIYQATGRTPLKDLNNIMEVLTPSPNRQRISIYAKHSAKNTAKKSVLKTSEKMNLYSSGGQAVNRTVTWSERLSDKKSKAATSPKLEMDGIRQNLKFAETEEDDELNQSILLKIQKAEEVLNAELCKSSVTAVPTPNMNDTYVTRPNRDLSLLTATPAHDNDTVIELLNGSQHSSASPQQSRTFKRPDTPPPARSQFPSSKVLPVLTGVTRLAATPRDDSIAGLLDNLMLDSKRKNDSPTAAGAAESEPSFVESTLEFNDGSPLLFSSYRRSRESKRSNETIETEEQNIDNEQQNIRQSSNLSEHSLVSHESLPALCGDNKDKVIPSQVEKIAKDKVDQKPDIDSILDITENVSAPTPLIKPIKALETSPELTETLVTIDRQIHKSKRRSAVLVRESLDNNDLQRQLKLILDQERKLEQQKLEIEKRLATVRMPTPTVSPQISKHLSVRASIESPMCAALEKSESLKLTTKPEDLPGTLNIDLLCLESPVESREGMLRESMLSQETPQSLQGTPASSSSCTSLHAENDTVIAGQLSDSSNITAQLDLETYEADDEISFMLPPSLTGVGTFGLRAISTGNKRRSVKRESINLMAFSPTLQQIEEQSDTNQSGQEQTICNESNTISNEHATNSSGHLSSEQLISQLHQRCSPSPTPAVTSAVDADCGDDTEMECTDYALCDDKMYTIDSTAVSEIPPTTALSQPLGSSLLVSSNSMLATVSPRSLQHQSSYIANMDCVNNGLPSRHYDNLLLGLSAHGNPKVDVCTPSVRRIGGTIGIYSPGNMSRIQNSETVHEISNGGNVNADEVQSLTALTSASQPDSSICVDTVTKLSECSNSVHTLNSESKPKVATGGNIMSTPTIILTPPCDSRPIVTPKSSNLDSSLISPLISNHVESVSSSLLTISSTIAPSPGYHTPSQQIRQTERSSSSDIATPDFFTTVKSRLAPKKKIGTPVSSLTITRLGERYREGLLDDEVSIYTCRVISNNMISGDSVRDISDPVCYSLLHGDERHFIPIHQEQSKQRLSIDGSAFYCFTP